MHKHTLNLNDAYELVIGIELHAQLITNSKIYSPEPNVFGESPNTVLSPITLAHPGSLPVFNQKIIEHAVSLCLATGCKIAKFNTFDRKNYFYPDLPKGYQITQYFNPIGRDGHLTLIISEQDQKQIRINRVHIEEDTGKSLHDQHLSKTFIDFNRAGRPLLEIVSEPDMHTAQEAALYVSQMRQLLRYLGISDGNMEEGNLRCDVNVSVRKKGDKNLGERTEIKNLNSITNVQKAIKCEFIRQVNLLQAGQCVTKSTLGFDVHKKNTFVLRSKEQTADYRYFPDPDLTPFQLTTDFIENIKCNLPSLPQNLHKYFIQVCGLKFIEANILVESKPLAEYYLELVKHTTSYKNAYNWLLGPVKAHLNKTGLTIKEFNIEPPKLASFINFVDSGKISYSLAQAQLFPAYLNNNDVNIEDLANNLSLLIQPDTKDMHKAIQEVIKKYYTRLPEYHAGKKNLLALFMGEIMNLTGGKINPKHASEALKKELDKYR